MTDELTRLTRRAEREHAARLEAERIAEEAISNLSRANRDLDALVEERTRDLGEALNRLEEANRVKGAFLRGLAHELATPVHAVQGFVELVATSSPDPEVRWAAGQAGAAAGRLNSAMRTLIEFAAVSSGELAINPEEVELAEFTDRLVGRWGPTATRAGTLLMAEVEPDAAPVVIDPERLAQILDALVDNAIRFGGTRVTVSVSTDDPVGGDRGLRLEVADHGPGFPVELRETAFDAFVRGNRELEGFGVGLTLARAVAEALGGTLRLDETDDDQGARLVAELPVAAVPTSP